MIMDRRYIGKLLTVLHVVHNLKIITYYKYVESNLLKLKYHVTMTLNKDHLF